MTVYTPGIPNAADLISSSQQPIKNNFGQLNTQFGMDHNPFWTGSANGDGHHKQVFFDVAAASNTPPLPTTPSGSANSVMYSAPDATSTNQEMFWANKQFNGGAAVQMTNSNLSAASGQGMMPGGLQMRCGVITGPGSSFTVSYTAFPTGTLVSFAISSGNPRTWQCVNIDSSSFTATPSSALANIDVFYWFAIGY